MGFIIQVVIGRARYEGIPLSVDKFLIIGVRSASKGATSSGTMSQPGMHLYVSSNATKRFQTILGLLHLLTS